MARSDLTERQRRFVAAYVVCHNITRAAIEAGCRPSVAPAIGSKWLKLVKVQDAVAEAKGMLVIRTHFTPDRVIEELRALAFSDVTNYVLDEDTGRLSLAPGAPADAMKAVQSIKYRVRTDEDGNVTRECEFRLWDKPGTLKLAGKHVGLFPDRDTDAIRAAAIDLVKAETVKLEERKRQRQLEASTVDVEVVTAKEKESETTKP